MTRWAVVFAGQGAQFVGMGRDLAAAYPECRALFERADEVLGYALSKVCFEGPLEELTRSDNCQPAIFVTSIACLAALRHEVPSFSFDATAGLSLGEWSALHAADAISFDDTLRVLQARGRFMQAACAERQGGMVSVIGLSEEKLKEICAATGVEIANLNSPEQTVLSGEKARIAEAEKMAQAAGAKRTVMLNVAGAFHSALMASAAARLEEFLKDVPIKTPSKPVISNVTGRPHGGPEEIRQAMVRQVTSAVQWVACVRYLQQNDITHYLECGPGRVLSGLIKRTHKDAELFDIQDIGTLHKTVASIGSQSG